MSEPGLSAAELAAVQARARATVDATTLASDDDLAAAVDRQLIRLSGRPSVLNRQRATVLGMAQVGLTIPSQEAVFDMPDVVSRRVFYDKKKGWYHDPLFREVLETCRGLYRKWASGAASREATADFIEREAKLRAAEWDMSREMTRLALEMARTPLHETEVSDDGKTIVVKPARWTMDTLPRLADASSKLGRLAMNMTPGGRQEVDVSWRDGLPEGVTPEQAEQVKVMVARMLAAAGDENGDGDDDDDL
jgi:hypothetical protein